MSDLDDEIARLEKEDEEQEKTKHAPSSKSIPAPKTNPSTLFPMLLANSLRAKKELEDRLKQNNKEAALTPESQVIQDSTENQETQNNSGTQDNESEKPPARFITLPDGSIVEDSEENRIPLEDSRKTEQTGEQILLKKAAEKEYHERLEDCGFCGICTQCKIYIYNSYKAEVYNMGLQAIEERIHMHRKSCITALERERVCRDLWEDALKKESEEVRRERMTLDGQYVIPEPKQGKRISKSAKDVADGKKPAKRISKDEKMANYLKDKGIDFKALMAGMASAAQRFNKENKK